MTYNDEVAERHFTTQAAVVFQFCILPAWLRKI